MLSTLSELLMIFILTLKGKIDNMNYEEKYNNALEVAKLLHDSNDGEYCNIVKSVAEQIFPELCPSNRNKEISKAIVDFFKRNFNNDDYINCNSGVTAGEIINWINQSQGTTFTVNGDKDKELDEFDKIDKIEPIFTDGDWIVYTKDGCKRVYQIVAVGDTHYFTNWGGVLNISTDEQYCRKWSLSDAEDGDFLSTENGTFIFCEIRTKDGNTRPIAYGGLNLWGEFVVVDDCKNPMNDGWTSSEVHPATDEEISKLIKIMASKGYYWNSAYKQIFKV